MKTIDGAKQEWYPRLASSLLFEPLLTAERTILWTMGETMGFEPGEPITREGDMSPSLFVVLSGTVKVHVDQQGADVYVCSLGEGSAFGESSLFLKMKRTANVTALDDVVVFKITRFDLFDFIKKYPTAGNRILLVLIYGLMRKLRDANQELAFERRNDSEQADIDALIESFGK